MNSFFEGKFELFREEQSIIIKKNGDIVKKIEIKCEEPELAKINIPLSNICNMNCKYCCEAIYNSQAPEIIYQDDGFAIISEYLDYIIANKCSIHQIQLTFDYGGEPTCQIHCMDIIVNFFKKRCHKLNLKPIVQVTTNASCSEDTMYTLCRIADEIIVSLDGDKDLHEKYRVHCSGKSIFNEIVENAKIAYFSGKLKQISSVITSDTITDVYRYANFFIENFPRSRIKVSPVITVGAAKTNNIKRLSLNEWEAFVVLLRKIAKDNIILIDSKPEKRIDKLYKYGCEHMSMSNWFCWLNKKITCCSDRKREAFQIGTFGNGVAKMNYIKMLDFERNNYIDNISKCKDCFAKYYCSGGCPSFRNDKIKCDERIAKYVRLLIDQI